jgi:hypothetical protein
MAGQAYAASCAYHVEMLHSSVHHITKATGAKISKNGYKREIYSTLLTRSTPAAPSCVEWPCHPGKCARKMSNPGIVAAIRDTVPIAPVLATTAAATAAVAIHVGSSRASSGAAALPRHRRNSPRAAAPPPRGAPPILILYCYYATCTVWDIPHS